MVFLEKDGGGGGGGTIEDRLKAVTEDRDALKEKLTGLDALTKERDELKADRDRLQELFDSLTKTATSAQDELKQTKDKLTTVTGERDTALRERDTANTNVGRLEKLCDLKGVDRTAAVPVAGGGSPQQQLSVDDFNTRLGAAKTPAEQTAVLNEFANAAREGKIK